MKILALSTSTPRGSAALLDGDRVLASTEYDDLRGHAERIFAALDQVLAAAGASRADLGAIACDVGPGSFTGVRVGVASAKGIALALGLPAVGIGSLEAMAAAAFAGPAAPLTASAPPRLALGDLVIPVIDAKKGELFVAAFDAPDAPPRLAPAHLLRDEVPAAIDALVGGARRVVVGAVADEIPALRHHLARGPGLDLPDAAWVGRAAAARLARQTPAAAAAEHDPARLEPLYVRAPDAKPAQLGYTPPR